MKGKAKRIPVADQIRKGLEEAIRHAKDEITLKRTTLEMTDSPPAIIDSASGLDPSGDLHPTV